MVEQLRKEHHSGLYLLHGKPGTGKTSFIKSVITRVEKPVIFLSPAMTDNLTSPALIGVLMDNPGSIIVIEDAETVLMKRQGDNSNAVANLLNLTDGFPADFLNLNIICTFNSSLDDIDPALLRKGRLKGIHKFRMLQPEQVKKLAKHLGVKADATKPMSLADVCNGGRTRISLKGKRSGLRVPADPV
jgi:ATP-dependent 26S proteasome regulatory subunit